MEFLPFAFCESVCQTLDRFELRILRVNRAKFWKTAAAETIDRRVNVALNISYRAFRPWENDNETWMYDLEVLDERNQPKNSITFNELQKLNRQHLQVKQVNIGLRPQLTSSLEEISEIVKFTIPFLCYTTLNISPDHNSSIMAWPEAISKILSLYQNVSFLSLFCFDTSRAIEEFVTNQLEQSTAPAFQLSLSSVQWAEDVRVAVEEFAISKSYASLAFYKAFVFSTAFFERLFYKPMIRSGFEFSGQFPFDFTQLQGFKTEIQDAAEGALLSGEWTSVTGETLAYQSIVWRRIDGVKVTATCLNKDHWRIRWSMIY